MSRPTLEEMAEELTQSKKISEDFYGKYKKALREKDDVASVSYAGSVIASFDQFGLASLQESNKGMIAECDEYLSTVEIKDAATTAKFATSPMRADEIFTLMFAMTNQDLAPKSYHRAAKMSSEIIGKIVGLNRDKLSLVEMLILKDLVCEKDAKCGSLNGTESQKEISKIADLKSQVVAIEIGQALAKKSIDATKLGDPKFVANRQSLELIAVYNSPPIESAARKSSAKSSSLIRGAQTTAANDFMGEVSRMMSLEEQGIQYNAEIGGGGVFCFTIDLERMRSFLKEREASYQAPAFVPLGVSPIFSESDRAVDGVTPPPVDFVEGAASSVAPKSGHFIRPSPITVPDASRQGSLSAAVRSNSGAGRHGSV